jgi:hypothetical protein
MMRLTAIAFCIVLLIGATYAAEIKITTGQASLMNKVDYSEAKPGNTYLVLPIQIENNGYSSLDYNPIYCKITIEGVQYTSAFIGYSLAQAGYRSLDDMVTLKDGGKIQGYMGFEVPAGSSNYEFTFEPIAILLYNIVYAKA